MADNNDDTRTDRWNPAENCYCGGPEEIYPHRRGTRPGCRKHAPSWPPVADNDLRARVRAVLDEYEDTDADAPVYPLWKAIQAVLSARPETEGA